MIAHRVLWGLAFLGIVLVVVWTVRYYWPQGPTCEVVETTPESMTWWVVDCDRVNDPAAWDCQTGCALAEMLTQWVSQGLAVGFVLFVVVFLGTECRSWWVARRRKQRQMGRNR